MPTSSLAFLRRLTNRLVGTGPWRIAPFDGIAAERTGELQAPVHRPESFVGVLCEEADSPVAYDCAHALLGQPALGETLDGSPRYRAYGLSPAEPKRLFTLTDAGIAGRDGVIYCIRTRTAVAETVRCWRQPGIAHPLLGAFGFPRAQTLPGRSLSLATLDGEGFYHFLFESLPRLWLARDFLARIDHVLVSGHRQAALEAWLARAGVAPEKLVWLDPLAHYRCDQLLFANRPIRNYQPSPWLRHALHSLLPSPAATAAAPRWLWISRADATRRHLQWEDEILSHFPTFEKHTLGSTPPAAQQALFASATVVAGPHGAGLSNLIFAPAGVRLVEFFPDSHIQPLYSRVAQVSGGTAAWATVDFARPDRLEPLVAALRDFLSA